MCTYSRWLIARNGVEISTNWVIAFIASSVSASTGFAAMSSIKVNAKRTAMIRLCADILKDPKKLEQSKKKQKKKSEILQVEGTARIYEVPSIVLVYFAHFLVACIVMSSVCTVILRRETLLCGVALYL